MKWNRIVFKLGVSILVLFLVVLLPLGYVINQIFSGFYYNEVQEEIEQLSARYARSITSLEDAEILNMFDALAFLTNKELYIVNADGEIVTSSGLPGLEQGEGIDLAELNRLTAGSSVKKRYTDAATGEQYLVSGQPIIRSNTFLGAVFVLSSVSGIQESVEKVRNLLILSGLGAFFIAVGFTFILSRKLSSPLVEMERATRKIAKGSLDARVNVQSGDEVGHLARAINDLAKELKRIHANRQEFFANISHELRTPITYLEGYANVLTQELYQTEAEKERYLAIILQETKRLTRLIEDLSELSKMEEGRIDVHLERVDVIEIIDDALLKTELSAKEKGLTIKKNVHEQTPDIYADGMRMEQIMINLLENAIRYTDKGIITIEVYRQHNVSIMIKDTGKGIPEKELPYIFERFHRVEKSRSRKYGGTGLGLAIVKHLVELQNGTIHASSQVGIGTVVEMEFPGVEGEGGGHERN